MIKDNIIGCILNREDKFLSIPEMIYKWHKNKECRYNFVSIDEVKQKFRKSEKLFILGTSEAIDEITEKQWGHVAEHDSFAMNWWPYHRFVPTFFQTAYSRNRLAFKKQMELLSSRSDYYGKTVLFLRDKLTRQGIHPRVFPELFNTNNICLYKYPKYIRFSHNLTEEDFQKGFMLRGQLNLALFLALQLGYKEIILLGIEWRNRVHFYHHYPEAGWMVESGYKKPIEDARKMEHQTNLPKKRKPPFTDYLKLLKEHVLDKEGIKLYVQKKDNPMHPLLDVYEF